jgi:hypothetical protein
MLLAFLRLQSRDERVTVIGSILPDAVLTAPPAIREPEPKWGRIVIVRADEGRVRMRAFFCSAAKRQVDSAMRTFPPLPLSSAPRERKENGET